MTFKELGLDAQMVSRLHAAGLTQPTPIQEQAIPHALQGHDILGIAQTGTGKTAAFGIPLILSLSRRQERPAPRTARGLVLAPTRELASQIVQSLQRMTSDLQVTLVVGGKSVTAQAARLARGTDILVATPGRLIDLVDRRALDLGQPHFLVLDEADQMLDMGFIHALRRIAAMVGPERQTMMFSATMPKLMADLSRHFLDKPIRVEASPPGKVADKVTHSVHFVASDRKQDLLVELLDGHRDDRALVFSRTKHGAKRLMKHLDRAGFAAISIHGNKSQGQRDRAIAAFRDGSARVLVATDVAARGIDIPGVGHVYNYDLPNVPENYVHRIGRTARAGQSGRAIAFCAADEVTELKAIERVLGTRVEVAGGSPWAAMTGAAAPKPAARGRRRSAAQRERLAA